MYKIESDWTCKHCGSSLLFAAGRCKKCGRDNA